VASVLKETQERLSQFVGGHLPITCLILEGDSFNVNQPAMDLTCVVAGGDEHDAGMKRRPKLSPGQLI